MCAARDQVNAPQRITLPINSESFVLHGLSAMKKLRNKATRCARLRRSILEVVGSLSEWLYSFVRFSKLHPVHVNMITGD